MEECNFNGGGIKRDGTCPPGDSDSGANGANGDLVGSILGVALGTGVGVGVGVGRLWI